MASNIWLFNGVKWLKCCLRGLACFQAGCNRDATAHAHEPEGIQTFFLFFFPRRPTPCCIVAQSRPPVNQWHELMGRFYSLGGEPALARSYNREETWKASGKAPKKDKSCWLSHFFSELPFTVQFSLKNLSPVFCVVGLLLQTLNLPLHRVQRVHTCHCSRFGYLRLEKTTNTLRLVLCKLPLPTHLVDSGMKKTTTIIIYRKIKYKIHDVRPRKKQKIFGM